VIKTRSYFLALYAIVIVAAFILPYPLGILQAAIGGFGIGSKLAFAAMGQVGSSDTEDRGK